MVCVMMRRSEMLVLSVKFGRCSPISVHAQGLARLGNGSSIHARVRMHEVTWAVLRRMPRTIFRATNRRRSSRTGHGNGEDDRAQHCKAAPETPTQRHARRSTRRSRPRHQGRGYRAAIAWLVAALSSPAPGSSPSPHAPLASPPAPGACCTA